MNFSIYRHENISFNAFDISSSLFFARMFGKADASGQMTAEAADACW
jgi:hypothetical protein